MSSSTRPIVPPEDLESFSQCLLSSNRVLALVGAGLSAASGLPTFRGAGGIWRTYDAVSLATPQAFEADPGLVWQFYSYRRNMALNVQPNPAHYALAELARRKPDFITLSQNVDGLSPRAGHPDSQLKLLHGSLFDVKCADFFCDYFEHNNFTNPIVPALAIPTSDQVNGQTTTRFLDIANEAIPIPTLTPEDLPQCPKCRQGILRPGVVWFGEVLPADTLESIDKWIDESENIDLILVIGTSAVVYPAAGYVDVAREKGARVAVINMDASDVPASGVSREDWFFQGDAGLIVPEILRCVIGSPSSA